MRKILVPLLTLMLLGTACGKSGSNGEETAMRSMASDGSTSESLSAEESDLAIVGPQVGMVNLGLTYSLMIPSSLDIVAASWNFGDATAVVNSMDPVLHGYRRAGAYVITVGVTDSNGSVTTLTQNVTVIPLNDDLNCVADLSVNGPTSATVGIPTNLAVNIPSCLTSKITAVHWNFGDDSAGTGTSVQHTYQEAGDVTVVVQLFTAASATTPWVSLTHHIAVSDFVEPTPTPTPTPAPTPTPTPHPLACLEEGQTRTKDGETFTEELSCGVSGKKTNTYRNVTTEKCTTTSEGLLWQFVSTEKHLVNEGECNGQMCEVPASAAAEIGGNGLIMINGKYYMADGTSKTFYTNASPADSCSTVAVTRSCSNGVLSGSSTASHLVCVNGCTGFGSNGTVKTGVVTGEVQVVKSCAFNETGIFDIFTQIEDQKCNAGQIEHSNTRQGEIKTAGVCPVYTWTATETWSACSADCGGTQTQKFECRDGAGQIASNDRCGDAAPVQTRVCDGNPDAVKRSESETHTEDAGSSATCPANQIGVVVSERDVTVTKNYACIDHSVQLESQNTVNGAWVTTSYCREYVPHRCSQDSLSNSQAHGRLAWMIKCQDKLPVIKEFLDQFGDVKIVNGKTEISIDANGRILYPTFMDRSKKPEKPWIAPIMATQECKMPSTVYVAAVCLSSCATPEQQIMAEIKANSQLKYMSFVDALNQKAGFVATLGDASTMSSKTVQKTKVDNWITELIDTDHVILEFHMRSGGTIRLTPNHPLLNAHSEMQLADEFKVGDSLVRLGGVLDPIVSIDRQNYFGKVYNVFVKSASPQHNIVVTNGYLNGTAFFQNEGAVNMNRALLRKQLIKGVFLNEKLLIGSAAGIVLIGGGLRFLNRGPSDLSGDNSAKLSSPVGTLVAGVSSGSGDGAAGARGPASVSAAGVAKAAGVSVTGAVPSEVAADLSDFKFERQEDLNLFRDLRKRVLPSEDDRAEKERLFRDAEFLNALAKLLKTQNMNEETLRNQNVALDLLIEAMQGQSAEAAAVLQSVITDSQVEDASVPQATRENLAGVKAEVLFQMSAFNPKMNSQLQAMLPGPVSQKIWANVQDRQQSNLAESSSEIKRK